MYCHGDKQDILELVRVFTPEFLLPVHGEDGDEDHVALADAVGLDRVSKPGLGDLEQE